MSTIALTVNGAAHAVDVDPATPLLCVLSDDLALRGPKFGCGLGQCGACTVIVRGRAVRSCVTPVGGLNGAEVMTLEGGALQGMSRALGEEVTWADQKVTSIDCRTFHSLPLGFDVPVIESVLVNRTAVGATGAGETAITIVAAAIGNAIFEATGARVREIPFTPERVKAALDARGA